MPQTPKFDPGEPEYRGQCPTCGLDWEHEYEPDGVDYVEDLRRENAELRKECAEKAVAERIVILIDYLRKDEADSVEICAANADVDGPDQIISVCGEWTDFNVEVIAGKTVLECLQTAADRRRKKEGK